ncbi:hypothetical protein KV557_00315 [Kitasatospora aureofaciens]|uniref:hypothetical protein n=1 Tax=Kitasatospora aureofaciens TaxID=1894 RepID=UPI001C47D5BA|nr:hypothetical protein [Kitasatospora aureofaciens]MBV6695570.1 hypothetical protein [Kitasatospora aureofaciens]
MTKSPATGPAPAPVIDGRPAFAGRQFVLERLGIDTWDLHRLHPDLGELRALGRHLENMARQLDNLDQELRRTAAGAIERLTKVRTGNHRDIQPHGVLRLLGSDLETLGARYDLAAEHLGHAVVQYREATERAAARPEQPRSLAARSRTSTTTATPAVAGEALTQAATGRQPPAAKALPPTRAPHR